MICTRRKRHHVLRWRAVESAVLMCHLLMHPVCIPESTCHNTLGVSPLASDIWQRGGPSTTCAAVGVVWLHIEPPATRCCRQEHSENHSEQPGSNRVVQPYDVDLPIHLVYDSLYSSFPGWTASDTSTRKLRVLSSDIAP